MRLTKFELRRIIREEYAELREDIEVDHSKYMASHGKRARGNGLWMFDLDGLGRFQYTGNLTQAVAAAKKEARKRAKEQGKHVFRIIVLP